MGNVLDSIDYKKVFKYFEEISDIPRGSKDNKKISDYLVKFAKEHHLKFEQDKALNVVIYKDATKGYENAGTCVLQAHMDMVCEKNADIEHDFEKEGLKLEIVDGYVTAKGTTLGADDGIGVAYALAVLADNTINHAPLVVIITTDEEIGMEGASALDKKYLENCKYMLNLDQEEEGIILVSCAGGLDCEGKLPLKYEDFIGVSFDLQLCGLKGGHSGTEINKHCLNVNKVMARLLKNVNKHTKIRLNSWYGGTKDNVIPNECNVNIIVEKENVDELLENIFKEYKILKDEYSSNEPDIKLYFKPKNEANKTDIENRKKYDNKTNKEENYRILTEKDYNKVVDCVCVLPDGVQKMSFEMENMVESSLNLGVLIVDEEKGMKTKHLIRSSVDLYKEYVYDKLEILYGTFEGEIKKGAGYLAWEYKKERDNEPSLRKMAKKVYTDMFENAPKIEAIHAGLECGIMSSKNKNMDIIAFGPEIKDIHTTRERLYIKSTIRMYDFLIKLLENIKE